MCQIPPILLRYESVSPGQVGGTGQISWRCIGHCSIELVKYCHKFSSSWTFTVRWTRIFSTAFSACYILLNMPSFPAISGTALRKMPSRWNHLFLDKWSAFSGIPMSAYYSFYFHAWVNGSSFRVLLIIPLWIPPLTGFQWIVRYELYCSHKPYGTSEPPFSSTKGYLPSILSVRKLLYIQQFYNSLLINLLTTILPNGNTLAYQLLVNIPLAQLRSLLRPVPEETPVPATRTFSFATSSLPYLPCPIEISPFERAAPNR